MSEAYERALSDGIDVLHVAECFEGGVGRAIVNIVRASPDLRHGLLATGADMQEPERLRDFVRVEQLRRGPIARALQVRRTNRLLRPRYVHAHSSWAGVFTRLALPPSTGIIYQPHGYAFEKPNRVLAGIFRSAETVLASRKQVVVVLSNRERNLAEGLSKGANTFLLPNIPTVPTRVKPDRDDYRRDLSQPLKLVMIGRLGAQKDPDFFARTVNATRERGLKCEGIWIGDGSAEERASLEGQGIRVTGWLETSVLVEEIDRADVYIHTGVYEGFPLSVLDAAARRRIVVVRDIPAFEGLGFANASSPEGLAALIERLDTNSSYRAEVAGAGEALLEGSSQTMLTRRLNALYE